VAPANGGIIVGGVTSTTSSSECPAASARLSLAVAVRVRGPPRRWFRVTAFAYGVCSALILDEFALWLNLRDVYWERQGRESVDALAIFAGVFLWGALIWPFAVAAWRHLRGRPPAPARHAGRRGG
jgi:hypothetical protein